jgi:hypothetical protein
MLLSSKLFEIVEEIGCNLIQNQKTINPPTFHCGGQATNAKQQFNSLLLSHLFPTAKIS